MGQIIPWRYKNILILKLEIKFNLRLEISPRSILNNNKKKEIDYLKLEGDT